MFEIDERPDLSFRLVVPRTPVTAPDHVAVRLSEVVVHSNRAILRSTGSDRLDGPDPARRGPTRRPYQAATARFDRVRDGDRLPLDNFLLYEGPVSGFLDLAVWVARYDQREVDLAELLQRETGRDDVKAGAGDARRACGGRPHAAVAVAAVAAVAILVRTGATLLDAAVGKSIGVYRTSPLPHERFGQETLPAATRIPACCARRTCHPPSRSLGPEPRPRDPQREVPIHPNAGRIVRGM